MENMGISRKTVCIINIKGEKFRKFESIKMFLVKFCLLAADKMCIKSRENEKLCFFLCEREFFQFPFRDKFYLFTNKKKREINSFGERTSN